LDLNVLKWRRRNRNVHLEKFQIFDLLGSFNRLVYIDADVLIHPEAPNIFEHVPATHLGVVNEQLRHEAEKRIEEWNLMQRRLGPLGISPTCYFNAGVMVTSARHRPMFDYRNRSFAAGRWPDQNTLNYAAVAMQMPIQWMGWEWNCMPLFPTFQEAEARRQAHFIHYAGESAKSALQEDIEYFYGQKIGV
jgi:lipopolysaccharide biosynthesis glycosyltransferase